MEMTGIERVVHRTPEVVELLNQVPGVVTRLRRALGPAAVPTWYASDADSLTHLYLVAGLAESVRNLSGRVVALEERNASMEEKLETIRAAELNWQAIGQTRDGIVFTNAAGQTVTISRNFLQAFADHRQLDVSSIEERGRDVVVLDEEDVIVQLPKSLWVVLHSVLDRCPWFPGTATVGREASPGPGNPPGFPPESTRDRTARPEEGDA